MGSLDTYWQRKANHANTIWPVTTNRPLSVNYGMNTAAYWCCQCNMRPPLPGGKNMYHIQEVSYQTPRQAVTCVWVLLTDVKKYWSIGAHTEKISKVLKICKDHFSKNLCTRNNQYGEKLGSNTAVRSLSHSKIHFLFVPTLKTYIIQRKPWKILATVSLPYKDISSFVSRSVRRTKPHQHVQLRLIWVVQKHSDSAFSIIGQLWGSTHYHLLDIWPIPWCQRNTRCYIWTTDEKAEVLPSNRQVLLSPQQVYHYEGGYLKPYQNAIYQPADWGIDLDTDWTELYSEDLSTTAKGRHVADHMVTYIWI